MNILRLKNVYFLGIGGIGMSALARFFRERGARVSGYDRTETALTHTLTAEGMDIHFTDDVNLADKAAELVVYTPAIPANHAELNWFRANGYPVYKRSDVLRDITISMFAITVAGTHGKTTISTMIAFLLRETGYGCNAFLGGISGNYNTNYWSSSNNTAVIEADEYDRSFLKLSPDIAVLTAVDPDHLDIYGTVAEMEEAFIQYTRNIKPGGTLLVKDGVNRQSSLACPNTLTYSLSGATSAYHAANIVSIDGGHNFDICGPGFVETGFRLNIGGLHNVENAIAATAVASMLGLPLAAIKKALPLFCGVKRRFEYVIRSENIVYIDDYAHHPEELAALIGGARELFPERKCVLIFQPHLFTRTRDLADGFAHSLDKADEIMVMDIYPARELPLPGVTAETITSRMQNPNHRIMSREEILTWVNENKVSLLITAGAGDIDKMTEPLKQIMEQKENNK